MITPVSHTLKLLLLIFLFFFSARTSYAVSINEFKHYSVVNGLTSDEVYFALKDSKGYIWFATDKGISRFDGTEFTTFGIAEGLPSPVIFWLAEGPQGKIWALTGKGEICSIVNDDIELFYTLPLKEYYEKADNFNNFQLDEKGNFYISTQNGRMVYISKNKEVSTYKIFSDRACLFVKKFDSGITLYGNNILYRKNPLTGFWLRIYNNENLEFEIDLNKELGNPLRTTIKNFAYFKNTYYISFHKVIFKIVDGKITKRLQLKEEAISKMYCDEEGNLWIGMYSNGVIQLTPDLEFKTHILNPYSVCHITQDYEENYWFTTLDHGVFQLPKKKLNKLHKGNITRLKKYENQVEYISNWNHFYIYKNGQNQLKYSIDQVYFKDFTHINGKYQFTFHRIFKGAIDEAKKLDDIIPVFHQGLVPKYPYDQNIISTYRKLIRYDSNLNQQSISGPDGRNRVFAIQGNKGYIANDNFLFQLDLNTNTFANFPYNFKTFITDIEIADPYLYVTTRGTGVLVFKDGKLVKHMNKENLLLFSDYTSCITVSNDTLWIGTNKGVNVVIDPIHSDVPKQFRLSHNDGLYSDNVTGIQVLGDSVYIATSSGLNNGSVEDLLSENVLIRTYITKVNDEILAESNAPLEFKHNNNDIVFHFTGVSFKHSSDLNYAIRILGQDSNWVNIGNARSALLNNLAPGNYTFQVKAFEKSNVLEPDEIIVAEKELIIHPAFWQTVWFYIFLIALLIFIITVVIYYRENRIKEKNNIRIQKYELTHKALSAQMNPHFIYNALGSIQSIIIANDTKKAIKYVASFANLMRRVLNSSDHLFVPLITEIATLEEYIKLEKLRFRQEFDFEWDIDPAIDKNIIQLPSMLLQPFIENAIVHGIRPAKHQGIIEVIIRKVSEDTLRIFINDNGVGRTKSIRKNAASPLHKSKGLKIVQKRLQLYSLLFGNNFYFQIQDLFDTEQQPAGTSIEIIIPTNSLAMVKKDV